MNGTTLAMDIGGTCIKSGLVDASGIVNLLENTVLPISPISSATEIARAFSEPAQKHAGCFDSVAICMPGPLDYPTGLSQMTHKFPSLFGLNLGTLLKDNCKSLQNKDISFFHDTCSFLIGEHWKGTVSDCQNCMGITLGTGIGVAAIVNNRLLMTESGCPSSEVSVWNRPFRDGRVEQYISSEAIVKHYQILSDSKHSILTVKQIVDLARENNDYANEALKHYALNLGEVLCEPANAIRPEAIVFGGQIAKAMDLLQQYILFKLNQSNITVRIRTSRLEERASLIGVTKLAHSIL